MAAKEPARGKWKQTAYVHDGESVEEALTKIPAGTPLNKVLFRVEYGYYEEVNYYLEWEVEEPEEEYQERLNRWREKQAVKERRRAKKV